MTALENPEMDGEIFLGILTNRLDQVAGFNQQRADFGAFVRAKGFCLD